MGTCLTVAACYPRNKGEQEGPSTASVSEVSRPAPVQPTAQDRAVSEPVLPNFNRAGEEIVRLTPRTFQNLPAAVVQELERRKCTIPQVWAAQAPGNVVTGHFTAAGQVDLALLCSRERVSSILVFRKSSPAEVAELATAPDVDYLQVVAGGRIGYSRALGVADSQYIQTHYLRYGGPKPPPLDHEGIDDAFVEKGSHVWYWYEGQWLQLTGAD